MVAVIDYDAGNIKSVIKAMEHMGEEVVLTRDRDKLLKADHVILPGVGAFGDAMERIHEYHLYEPIKEVVAKKTPFLGICLGLQLLFESSEESEGVEGLSILKGKIVKIPDFKETLADGTVVDAKIPHMGWNSLSIRPDKKLFAGVKDSSYVYFVHSFYLKAENESDVAATTEYGTLIHASVEHENVFGCQFHPEKSGEPGLQILRNFIAL